MLNKFSLHFITHISKNFLLSGKVYVQTKLNLKSYRHTTIYKCSSNVPIFEIQVYAFFVLFFFLAEGM